MADEKITELTAITLPAADDIVVIVDDISGTPVTRKITHDDLLFGANGTPSTQAHDDAAAIGAALDAARSDHKHAMPAAGGAKVWGFIAGNGALSSPSYGISSVTDVGTGDRTINFSTNFSADVYSGTCIVFEDNDLGAYGTFHTPTVGTVKHIVRSMDNASGGHQKGLVRDAATSIAIYGDQ